MFPSDYKTPRCFRRIFLIIFSRTGRPYAAPLATLGGGASPLARTLDAAVLFVFFMTFGQGTDMAGTMSVQNSHLVQIAKWG